MYFNTKVFYGRKNKKTTGELVVCYHHDKPEEQKNKVINAVSTDGDRKSIHLDFKMNGCEYSFDLYSDCFGVSKVIAPDGEREILFSQCFTE